MYHNQLPFAINRVRYRILWATDYSKYLINPDILFNKLVQCKLSSFLILKIDEGHNERQSAAR